MPRPKRFSVFGLLAIGVLLQGCIQDRSMDRMRREFAVDVSRDLDSVAGEMRVILIRDLEEQTSLAFKEIALNYKVALLELHSNGLLKPKYAADAAAILIEERERARGELISVAHHYTEIMSKIRDGATAIVALEEVESEIERIRRRALIDALSSTSELTASVMTGVDMSAIDSDFLSVVVGGIQNLDDMVREIEVTQ